MKEIEAKSGRNATDEEVASKLGLTGEELLNWQSQLKVTNLVSLNDYVEQGGEPVMDASHNSHFAQPEQVVEEEELYRVLRDSLEKKRLYCYIIMRR